MSLGLAAFKLGPEVRPAVPQKSANLVSTSVSVPVAPPTKAQSDLFAAHQEVAQQLTSSSNSTQTTNTASSLLEDVEKHGDPIKIGGQMFTVASHSKRIKGKTGVDTEAITSLEIRDASGAIAFQESFSYSFDKGEFDELCSASTEVLPGSMGNWLLVSSECLPDAPLSGGPWQILGVANNKLVPWGKPLYTLGKWLRFVPGKVSKTGAATTFGLDMIELKVWTGNFFVTLPVRIDFNEPKLEPGIRCISQAGRSPAESGCEVPVEANRDPAGDDTFVRLFPEPAKGTGTPSHVIIHKNSTVEFLAANVRIVFDDSDGSIALGVADDAWLKVRIDGKTGWIHTQEDLEAIGLHFSG